MLVLMEPFFRMMMHLDRNVKTFLQENVSVPLEPSNCSHLNQAESLWWKSNRKSSRLGLILQNWCVYCRVTQLECDGWRRLFFCGDVDKWKAVRKSRGANKVSAFNFHQSTSPSPRLCDCIILSSISKIMTKNFSLCHENISRTPASVPDCESTRACLL